MRGSSQLSIRDLGIGGAGQSLRECVREVSQHDTGKSYTSPNSVHVCCPAHDNGMCSMT